VRNRDLEFAESRKPSKAGVLHKFDEAISVVIATIEKQSDSDWTAPHTAEGEPESKDRVTLFLRCASHFYHHIGQIIYLSRELRKS
jgi:uncharacterized protein DUF1572